jgi:hypothetical protein
VLRLDQTGPPQRAGADPVVTFRKSELIATRTGAGTIAHRASVLQNETSDVAAGNLAAGAHCVDGGVAATPRPRPRNQPPQE